MDYYHNIVAAGDRDNVHGVQQHYHHYLRDYDSACFDYSGRINNPTGINNNDQHSSINNLYPNNIHSFDDNYCYHRNDHYVCSDCNHLFHAAARLTAPVGLSRLRCTHNGFQLTPQLPVCR